MSVVYPKITQLSIDSFGLSETLYEPKDKILSYVLCDAINLNNPSENLIIAKAFERNIRQYLQMHSSEISEKILKKAIEHAQNYFFKNFLPFENRLKVGAVIIIEHPSLHFPDKKKVFIAGIGDIKVYHLDTSLQLVYYDAEIPKLPDNLSFKKRFNYITNAIGAPDIRCSITTTDITPQSSLLISTYGGYNASNKEKLYTLFSDFENKKPHIHKFIQRNKEKDHFKSLSLISFDQPKNETSNPQETNLCAEEMKKEEKKERFFPMWAIKIGLFALICLLCLEFFNYYINATKSDHISPGKVTAKVEEENVNLRSLKRPLEFPFLKERAYIVDLKQKYENQNQMIEKLQEIIKEQDILLRNMQIKNYYHPDTISAKPFRTREKKKNEKLEKETPDNAQ